MPKGIRIKKVKRIKGDRVNIKFQSGGGEAGYDEYDIICKEEPKPDFHKALDDLKPHLTELCELPAKDTKLTKINGVDFTYAGENDVMGAVIMGTKALVNSDAGLALNSPHKTDGAYKGEKADPKTLLGKDLVKALKKVQKEAANYLEGIRHQTNIFRDK